ncbi:hypothetical protein ACH5RR_026195 [Cinchona calisaya]|uniref:Uncharacterized protein n=1 Tax=Cinchona calisaya TaxID=153742 RepID=A0ABD2Z1U6_9GENT
MKVDRNIEFISDLINPSSTSAGYVLSASFHFERQALGHEVQHNEASLPVSVGLHGGINFELLQIGCNDFSSEPLQLISRKNLVILQTTEL